MIAGERMFEASAFSQSSLGGSRKTWLERLARAKKSFACRRATFDRVHDVSNTVRPCAGDLLLATVTEIGHHARLETPEGRRAQLYVGDEIVVAFGARYAPDQFEALVPEDLGDCDLVAGGGIAARAVARHARARKPTAIKPIGILTDAGGSAVNVAQFALQPRELRPRARNLVAVVGTSMNAGKTTAAANLIRGLSKGGLRVGACKVTGTGSGGDIWSMRDAGAITVLDFTDVGFATTAGADIDAIDRGALALVAELEAEDIDIVVAEIADGLLQQETAALLTAPRGFASRIDTLLLAAADSMGAVAGAEWLRAKNLPLRAVTGLVTASPLGMREAQSQLPVEVVSSRSLAEAEVAARMSLLAVRASLIVVS
ncbi:MAG: DUF1611 domain-containing protein [Terricaulis sp.]